MKRDMDLIRRIVLAIRDHESKPMLIEAYVASESMEVGDGDLRSEAWDNIEIPESFIYHIQLLIESGLVSGTDLGIRGEPDSFVNLALTWAGQDFADNVANDTVWGNVKKALKDSDVKSASFSIWAQVIAQQVAMNLGIA